MSRKPLMGHFVKEGCWERNICKRNEWETWSRRKETHCLDARAEKGRAGAGGEGRDGTGAELSRGAEGQGLG